MNRINPSMDWKKNKNQHESSHSGDHHKALSPKKNLWEKDSNGNALNQEHLEGAKDFADGLDLTSPVDEFELWPTPPKPRSFFLPVHYTASYRYPLIVWLHHDGFNEHQIDQIMPHVSTRNYIGIGIRGNQAADSAGHCFGWHDSPAAIDSTHDAIQEAIAEAKHRFSIHASRIILAGYRSGGTMAQRIALRTPDQIAGVISMGGPMPRGEFGRFEELRQRKLPMLWQWSSKNSLYNETNIREDCQLAMSISADVEIRQYADDDEMNTVALRDTNDWIMRKLIPDSSISDSEQWSSKPIAYSQN